jgi:hypothetical protein
LRCRPRALRPRRNPVPSAPAATVTGVMQTRFRPLAAGLVLVGAALFIGAASAHADPAGDATAGLRTAGLYVSPELASVRIDPAVAAAVPADLKIAVLPAGAGLPITLAGQIDQRLGASPGHPITVAVFTVGGPGQVALRAASSKYCPGLADAQAQAAADVDQAQLANVDLSSTIHDLVTRLSRARVDRGDCGGATARADGGSSAVAVGAWVVGIVLIGGAAIAALVVYGRRSRPGPDAAADGTEEDLSGVLSGALFGYASESAEEDGELVAGGSRDSGGGGDPGGGAEATR